MGVDEPRRPSWWSRIEGLPDEERAAFLERIRAALPPVRLRYSPYVPMPKQDAFLRLRNVEAFYGGAAGPGKSTTLLMGALQYADVPGYSALLLRRTYADLSLPGALLDMASAWLSETDAAWNATLKTWSFPSGATLTFGYLATEEDKRRYASAAFQFVGFDELTHFTESQYRFLFSRLRKPSASVGAAGDGTTIVDVPLRMRSASNPGGPGHEWVRRRFVHEPTRSAGAVFMPALLSENPNLDQEAYLESLAHLPEIEQRRLIRGDWSAKDAGTAFDTSKLRVVSRLEAAEAGFGVYSNGRPARIRRARCWDMAATEPSASATDPDYTVGTLLALCEGSGLWMIEDVVRVRVASHDVESTIAATCRRDGRDVPVWITQEPGAAGKSLVNHYARNVLRGIAAVHGWRETGDKETRARIPSAAIGRGLVLVLEGGFVEALVEELDAFPNGTHDDIVDTLSLGWYALSRGGTMRLAAPPRAS